MTTRIARLLTALVLGVSCPQLLAGDGSPSAHQAWTFEAPRAVSVGGGFVVHDRGQRWSTLFDGTGFETRPDTGDWSWGLELARFGRSGAVRDVQGPCEARARGSRIEVAWSDTLTEWYTNDARGLEHGYTLEERPEGTGNLVFELRTRGGLLPVVSSSRRGVEFVDARGATRVRYRGLHVFDARGRSLDAAFEELGDTVVLTVADDGADYPLTVDPVAQQVYVKASNTGSQDNFGFDVDVSGDLMVVGAHLEDSWSAGVGGHQFNNNAANAGAAFVFSRAGGSWEQVAYLKSSDPDAGDEFGKAVAVSGETVAVGAPLEDGADSGLNGHSSDNSLPESGAVFVFVQSGGQWTQQAYVKPLNPDFGGQFGSSVALAGDVLVVGCQNENSGAVGVDMDPGASIVWDSGAVYVFRRDGTVWSQEAYLKPSNTGREDHFGRCVAFDGETIVVGASAEDSAATTVDGDQTNDLAQDAGAAYVFERAGSSWAQTAYLKASNAEAVDHFGFSVAVSGTRIVVGAETESSRATGVNGNQADNTRMFAGAAYVFEKVGGAWVQDAYLKAFNTQASDRFGWSVAIRGDLVAVGAPFEDSSATGLDGPELDEGSPNSGAVYLFRKRATGWERRAYVKASNTGPSDFFGTSVVLEDGLLAVGANGEDSAATGVDGDQSLNSGFRSGAVYLFEVDSGLPVSYCFGDGLDRPCKCGNDDALDTRTGGCLNSTGAGAVLTSNELVGVTANSLQFDLTGGVPTALAVLVSGDNALAGGLGVLGMPESDGLRCVGGHLLRHGARALDSAGATPASWGTVLGKPPGGLIAHAGFVAGQTRHFQVRYREDPLAGPCGFGTNTSQAIRVTFEP